MESLHYLLMKSHAVFSRRVLSEAVKIGLTAGQPKILEFLDSCEEADQKTIASYCEIEQTTAGSILLRMEKAGLVIRRQHDGNRRSLFVSLTDRGRETAGQVKEIFARTEQPIEAALSEAEQKCLRELLEKAYCAITDTTSEGGSQK